MMNHHALTLATVTLLGTPALTLAHPGHAGSDASGLLQGLTHPILGLDHVLAMVAVGLLAAQMGGRARLALPVSFLAAMTLGGVLGMVGFALPYVEPVILASIVILGVMLAAAFALRLPAAVAVVGVLALFHGNAHGQEMPETASGLLYAMGFLIATAFLHAVGLGAGLLAARANSKAWLRYAGVATAVVGVCLVLF